MKEMRRKEYTLDFSNCRYVGELYAVIRKQMELPQWVGNNYSAFWDCLTGMIEVPATIIFHIQTPNRELQAYMKNLIAVARRAEKESDLDITVEVVGE